MNRLFICNSLAREVDYGTCTKTCTNSFCALLLYIVFQCVLCILINTLLQVLALKGGVLAPGARTPLVEKTSERHNKRITIPSFSVISQVGKSCVSVLQTYFIIVTCTCPRTHKICNS